MSAKDRRRSASAKEWAQSMHYVDRELFVAYNRPVQRELAVKGRRGNESAAKQARILQRKIEACRKVAKGEGK